MMLRCGCNLVLCVVLLQGAAADALFAQTVLNNAQVSPHIYQPWQNNTGNQYQLVADTRTPPPVKTTIGETLPVAVPYSPPHKTFGSELLDEFRPSNDRNWSQNHKVLQTAAFNGNLAVIHNVRYSRYESAEKYTTAYYDAVFNLDEIESMDLIIVPFRGMPRMAHVESSFGFKDGRHIGMSIEARYETNEKYDPVGAFLNQFELIYVFADERDMIRLGTDVHKNDVYVYRLNFTVQEIRTIFIDALQRANKLAKTPEFYKPMSNSCVTNLLNHIGKARPKAVPKDIKTIIPGLLDKHFYDLKLMALAQPTFKETKEQAKVNPYVEKFGDLEYFSAGIRQNQLR